MKRKLSDADVVEIRRLYALGGITQKVIADRYGVRAPTITTLVNGNRRKNADPDRPTVFEHAGTTWYRRDGRYWYKAPTGSGRAYEWRDACAGCGQGFFAARGGTATQGLCCSIRCSRTGERNPAWSAERVLYRGMHRRVVIERGKASSCSVDGCVTDSKWFHWANLRDDYRDMADYASMCVFHHHAYDWARILGMDPDEALARISAIPAEVQRTRSAARTAALLSS